MSTFPKKMIGSWNLVEIEDGLEAFTVRIFTQFLGWKLEEVQVLLANVRKDLRNPRIHMLFELYVSLAPPPLFLKKLTPFLQNSVDSALLAFPSTDEGCFGRKRYVAYAQKPVGSKPTETSPPPAPSAAPAPTAASAVGE